MSQLWITIHADRIFFLIVFMKKEISLDLFKMNKSFFIFLPNGCSFHLWIWNVWIIQTLSYNCISTIQCFLYCSILVFFCKAAS